jgi:hypothetical protein
MGVLGRGWWLLRMATIVVVGALVYVIPISVHVEMIPPWLAKEPHVAWSLKWFASLWPLVVGLLVGYRASLCRGAGPGVGFAIGLVVSLPFVMLVDVHPTGIGPVLAGKTVVLLWFLTPPTIGGLLAGWMRARHRRGRKRQAA